MPARIRLADLAPKVRRKLVDSAGATFTSRPKVRTGPAAPAGKAATRLAWLCHACPFTSTSWAACERHSDETGHHRLDIQLVPKEG
jgi:hypothetical protein